LYGVTPRELQSSPPRRSSDLSRTSVVTETDPPAGFTSTGSQKIAIAAPAKPGRVTLLIAISATWLGRGGDRYFLRSRAREASGQIGRAHALTPVTWPSRMPFC